MSSQLSCGDTHQILKLFKDLTRYLCKIEYFLSGEITEQSLSNPHSRPESGHCWQQDMPGRVWGGGY